ncbi:hypothetical protein [Mucilaginibacter sp.]|uniref:hypothetical protein n=1 Tax=Mucilaginibacter sp. TaxID=1882438 RepID=UPI0035BBE333
MLRSSLFLVIFFAAFTAVGQGRLKGRVFENKTRIGLAGIRVENLSNSQSILTNNDGKFTLSAKTGDLLLLKGFAYKNDTVLVTSMADQEIFMVPQTNDLAQVNVVATVAPKLNTYYDPLYHGQSVLMVRDKKGRATGGVIIRLWYWKKDEHKKAKAESREHMYALMDRITQVFTPQIIGKYIPLKGQEMEDFLEMYTPDVSIFSAKSFDLTSYLNDCYKKYQQLPSDQRKPKRLKLN